MKTIDLTTYATAGYEMYRVPGIVVAGDGEVLLYCEGRQTDESRRTLLWCRSEDGGESFSPWTVRKAAADGKTVHNPQMIAGDGKNLWFLWNEDYQRLFMQKSEDGGRSWGPVRDLTSEVRQWAPEWPLTLFAVAPGHGIKMKNGILVVPLWLSRGINTHNPACFGCLYSPDGGESWLRSTLVRGNADVVDPTEGAVAERADGTLLATMRHSAPYTRQRAFAAGGPASWGEAFLQKDLPDPICAGSLLALQNGQMLFSNCAWQDEGYLSSGRTESKPHWSRDARQRLTVRVSTNDGVSFSKGTIIAQQAGYSDLAASVDGRWIYCFYEHGWIDGDCVRNKHLSFTKLAKEELR